MNKYAPLKLSIVAMVGLLWLNGARTVNAQFTQNRETIRVDISSYPAEIQKDYGVFAVRCGGCHSLDTSLKLNASAAPMQAKTWEALIRKMQAKASSHVSDKDVRSILAFLEYDATRRKPASAASAQTMPMMPMMMGMMGKQLYDAQNCGSCHAIAGQGGSVGPDLDDVGSRLSREQIVNVLQGKNAKASGVMPLLPADISEHELNALVDYLQSLKR
jgi:mono/diheme cytochrome c family protein